MPSLLGRAACGKGMAYQLEARDAARTLTGDVAYLDPPYNQHKYLGNYHIWRLLSAGTLPRHTASRASASTAETAAATSIASRESAQRWLTLLSSLTCVTSLFVQQRGVRQPR